MKSWKRPSELNFVVLNFVARLFFFFFFFFFFYESLWAKKKQGIQDSIANEKYPDYKSPNKMTRKLILKVNLSIFETSRGSCIGYITGQSIPIRNSVRHK